MAHTLLALAAVLVCGPGCTVAFDADRKQCNKDADCSQRGSAFEGSRCVDSVCQAQTKWGCLDQGAPSTPQPGPYQVRMTLQGMLENPLPGIETRICRIIDVSCEAPDHIAHTDQDGVVTLPINPGFNGYIQLTGDAILPALYFFNPPVTSNLELTPPMRLLDATTAAVVSTVIDVKISPERAVLVLSSHDCAGGAAAGVSFSVTDADAETVPFYSVSGLPNRAVTATDGDGFGGFVNVKPGTVAVSGKLEADQRLLSSIGVIARAGAITYTRVVPLAE